MNLKTIKASGVLPISINPQGEIVLLLGKEVDLTSWCGFGGKIERGETVEEGAAREFEEESMALWMDRSDMLNILKHNQDRRLVARYTDGIYQEFAVYFKYDPNIPSQFSRVFRYIGQCKGSCPEGHLEKSQVKWFKLSNLIRADHSIKLRPCFERTLLKSYPYLERGMNQLIKNEL